MRLGKSQGYGQYAIAFLLTIVTFAGCAGNAPVKVPANQAQLSKVKILGIATKVDESFSARLSRDRPPVAAFGLVGLAIDAAASSTKDSTLGDSFQQALGDFNPQAILDEKLKQQLESQKTFTRVDTVGGKSSDQWKQAGLDAVMTVNLEQWGLRACAPNSQDTTLRVAATAHGRLQILADDSIAWERTEVYQDPECLPAESFRSTDGQLRNSLANAMEIIAERLANDILFP